MQKYFLLILIVLFSFSCASKRYARKAREFEKAGLYEDAAHFYYKSVEKNGKNVEAKLGLRKNGQKLLEKKLYAFTVAHKQSNHKKAVYAFNEASQYRDQLKRVGVDLSMPGYYSEYYKESEKAYLNSRYAQGMEELERKNYEKAYEIFNEIKGIDPAYKDVTKKHNIARYEPLYNKGNDQLNNGLYRSAYHTFDGIIQGTGGYKQALNLKSEALEKATTTILIPGFLSYHYKSKKDAITVTNQLKGALSKLDNSFIKVMDASGLKADIYDGQNRRKINYQAAALAGIKAVLKGRIVSSGVKEGKTERSTRKGYLKRKITTTNEQGEEVEDYKYHKTQYMEYRKQNSAFLEVNFELISTETNEILVTDQFTVTETDQVHFATFKGNKKELVPGFWVKRDKDDPRDVIKDNKTDVRRLRELLEAENKLDTSDELKAGLYKKITRRMVEKIDQYNPED